MCKETANCRQQKNATSIALCLESAHQGWPALQGIRKVPTRLRIQISRRRNDDEDAQVRHTQQSLQHSHCEVYAQQYQSAACCGAPHMAEVHAGINL